MNRIKRISLFFRIIFQIIFITLPLLSVVSWMYAPDSLVLLHGMIHMDAIPASYLGPHAYMANGVPEKVILHTLSNTEKFYGFLASAIPLMIELYIIYLLIQLFRMYEKGEIFSILHVRHIRNIGYALLAGQLFEPIYQLLMGLILTLHNPPGHRFMAITLDQTNVGMLLTGLLVILISWIVAEGLKLRVEQQFTV